MDVKGDTAAKPVLKPNTEVRAKVDQAKEHLAKLNEMKSKIEAEISVAKSVIEHPKEEVTPPWRRKGSEPPWRTTYY